MEIILVDELYKSVNDWANKHQTGAFVSPEEFNRMMVDEVYSFIRRLYGLENEYQPGSPMPRITYEETQLVIDYLSGLKVAEYKMQINKDGKGNLPDDYLHKGAGRYVYQKPGPPDPGPTHVCSDDCEHPCEKVTHAGTYQQSQSPTYTAVNRPIKWVIESAYEFALCSVNRPANKEYPIGVFRDNHIQFAPADLKEVLFTYLRYPKKPLFTWNYVGDDVVFTRTNAQFPTPGANAVDIELPLICQKQISAMIAQRMGFFTRDVPLIQATQSVKDKGI